LSRYAPARIGVEPFLAWREDQLRLDRDGSHHHRSAGGYQESAMSWKKPVIVEIALGAEINSYACAGRK
jgi:coenzyme PQQ precursor peptide PqqA